MLKKKYNPRRKRDEWALVSISKPGKILKWFGIKKPSDVRLEKEERRARYFKHKK